MMNDWIENSEDIKEYQDRYPYLYGAVLVLFLILFSRLWYLQILKGSDFKRFSEQNQIKEEKNPAPRGMLLDRNGQILVDSLPTFNVTLTPQYIVALEKTATDLAKLLGIKREEIIEKVKSSRKQNGIFKPVHIKENVSRDEVALIERIKIDTPGLEVEMGIKRNYLLGDNGAQLFGYTGEISKEELPVLNTGRNEETKLRSGDIIGKSGLEKRWDQDLRGIDGARFVEVDARGREITGSRTLISSGFPEETDYVPGRNITLTIDKDLQQAAYDSFVRNKRMGSIVALDPRTGEILAMINSPSFDPNHFSTGIPPEIWAQLVNDPFKPLRNKAIQDHFPPGSTFKAVVALAALQEKIVTPNSTFFCPGFLKFGKRPYHCWQQRGHGYVNVYQAMERSCDVFFYQLGISLGIDRIAKYARLLGLGSKTGIQLDNERAGLIPDSEWKKKTLGEEWQPGENLSNAIGQGFILTTPLQLATAYASIGSDGKFYRPYVIKKIHDAEGAVRTEFEPQLLMDAQNPATPDSPHISAENFHVVKKALGLVFGGQRGTAHAHRIPGVDIGGKTGTVQLFQLSADAIYSKCEARDLKQRHHGWMAAFAPAENPQIVVAVLAEHACHGSSAGPVIRDVIHTYLKKYNPDLLKEAEIKAKKQARSPPAEAPPAAPATEGDE
jgi:penicillin-binding protein 2